MAKVTLPWFNDAQPFTPKTKIADLEAAESLEADFFTKGGSGSVLVKARAAWLAGVLARTAEKPTVLDLDAPAINAAFRAVWMASLAASEDDDPLEHSRP